MDFNTYHLILATDTELSFKREYENGREEKISVLQSIQQSDVHK